MQPFKLGLVIRRLARWRDRLSLRRSAVRMTPALRLAPMAECLTSGDAVGDALAVPFAPAGPIAFAAADTLAAGESICPAGPLAATAPVAAIGPKRPLSPALAVLLAGHIIRDGEVVQLILKPSLWFIPLTSLKFIAAAAICAITAKLAFPEHLAWYYVEAAAFLIVGRLMWATLHWVNRIYVLTDMRVLRLSGVFNVDVFDCPLRKIAAVRLTRSCRERLFRLGSIEILPQDEFSPAGVWQTIRKPREIEAAIQQAIRRSRYGRGSGIAA